ncbi:MAG: hypothetical protein A2750_03510 [Candidatus Yanofskybacteria bacterium RIFCSPHIGHO2_01_FULL_45_42]|uniref:Gingipain domain-containing protein n=3 Tax=Candidatus Yanofskyibacteriota TaxID=1752733 RepID=A0A1F8H2D0_9BACT|nr:MAG: hypothetical protein A2750_03510 [Candidatus Yanofskybacteria bacterium RIFCSPHIGHO2_01_FULL_45_42]OGN16138.1 MAG: hypothetical protein A3C81_01000 [Candidatus Yanofskybacteria bacterium RIFCSPHIGHO2_02_FULL_46_19]OGN26242.1 MAG: hypothetical protein A3B17_02660 [Candidatus Yanofskybacteria bacterium RIFCSPLOWO2_01_FULL_45_72]OGN31792.1 MAG: hypothetical protein A3J01_03315 [Candidatus Yanofskybacteria bacterium RIFCSPLOWO2_02_FULL_45_18]
MDRRAIVIIGDDRRFLLESKEFLHFLTSELGLTDIRVIKTAYMNQGHFKQILKDAIYYGNIEKPMLMVYNGHAEKGGWKINDYNYFPYDELARVVAGYGGPLLIINSCCHAYSLASFLECLPPQEIGLLAACDTNQKEYDGFTEDIANSWRRGKCSDDGPAITFKDEKPRRRRCWGVKLDCYFFKQQKAPPWRN